MRAPSDGAARDVVIDVSRVSKRFKLYHSPVLGPLKDLLFFGRGKHLYREHVAVDDVSFSVQRGEVVGIIGPNGAGKTTLLKMIAGLLPLESGCITVNGSITALLALGVGVHPEFTGRENILFSGLLLGMSRDEIAAKAESIIEFSEIGPFIDQPFRTYSSGMKARLLFSISMSVQPDILIVDEALATGDAAFVRKCERRIRELCASGTTILFVSHNLTQVNSLCDRSLLIMSGRLVCDGPPAEVFQRYKELYLQSESQKLTLQATGGQLRLLGGDGSLSVQQVVLRDRAGRESNVFYTGDPMSIEIVLDRHRPGRPYYLFLGFLSGGQYLGQITTENLVTEDGIRRCSFDDARSIRFEIRNLVMLNGTFSFWLWFIDAETRETVAEYRAIAPFRVAKRDYPFDADAYFSQPIAGLVVDGTLRN